MSEAKNTALGGSTMNGYSGGIQDATVIHSHIMITLIFILAALVLVTEWDSSLSRR